MKGSVIDSVIMLVIGVMVLVSISFVIHRFLVAKLATSIEHSPDYNTRKLAGILNSLVPGIPLNTFYSLPDGDCEIVVTNNTIMFSDTGDFSVRGRLAKNFDVEPFSAKCGKSPKLVLIKFDGSVVKFEERDN